MKKVEILKNYTATRVDDNTVFIKNQYFDFSFTKADSVVKDEFKGKFKYFGGLQCNYKKESQEYKNLESWLCTIANSMLNHQNCKCC